jgi:uncharacterized protein with beta-barrel porin domain
MTRDNQIGRILRGLALSAGLLLMAIPAALAGTQAERVAREQHACAEILGLNPSQAGYDACITTLDRARSDPQQGNEAAVCAYVGLGPTASALDQCADELRATLWNQENLGAR